MFLTPQWQNVAESLVQTAKTQMPNKTHVHPPSPCSAQRVQTSTQQDSRLQDFPAIKHMLKTHDKKSRKTKLLTVVYKNPLLSLYKLSEPADLGKTLLMHPKCW